MLGRHGKRYLRFSVIVFCAASFFACDDSSSPVLDGGPPRLDRGPLVDRGTLDSVVATDGGPQSDGAGSDGAVADTSVDMGARGACATADAGGTEPTVCVGGNCPTGLHCETVSNVCVQCLEDNDCTAGDGNTGFCSSEHVCTRCTKPKDCRDANLPLRCDMSGGEGRCVDCLDDAQCSAGAAQTTLCYEGFCIGCVAGTDCSVVDPSATCVGI